jgi:hypothetical protein
MQKINNQQSKSKKMVRKRTAEVWQRPPADDGNVATATAMAMAIALVKEATTAVAEGNGCDEGNGIVDDSSGGRGKAKGNGNGCGGGSSIGTALRAMLVAPVEARPTAVVIVRVWATKQWLR